MLPVTLHAEEAHEQLATSELGEAVTEDDVSSPTAHCCALSLQPNSIRTLTSNFLKVNTGID